MLGADITSLASIREAIHSAISLLTIEDSAVEGVVRGRHWRGPDSEQAVELIRELMAGPTIVLLEHLRQAELELTQSIRRQQEASRSPHSPGHMCGPGTPWGC